MLAGAAAGLTNGFFGGGGGSVLVPMLTRVCGLDQRRAFATSVAVILPLCAAMPQNVAIAGIDPADLIGIHTYCRDADIEVIDARYLRKV